MPKKDLTKIAYKTLQQGKSIAGLAHKELSTKVMEFFSPESIPKTSKVSRELLNELRKSMIELEEVDWEEAENGIYPKTLLFEAPWLDWLKKYPLIWLDLPSTWIRRKNKNTRDIPKRINRENYPSYYLQNFHHQTDGYLSDKSAELYDIQVEILFNGTADAMRRRILSPLKEGLNKFNLDQTKLKILDVATGTGRTLQQMRSTFPETNITGIDLSGSYLKQASKYLNNRDGEMVELVKGNVENMPFNDESFHAITCVFLFHELPREARQNVINECYRILKPGGSFILADSIQLSDSPKFNSVMENFRKFFHEPYYIDYVKDDISEKLVKRGFNEVSSNSFFMTKVWSAKKE